MVELGHIFADGLTTAVYVYSSHVFLAIFAALAVWVTRPWDANSLEATYGHA